MIYESFSHNRTINFDAFMYVLHRDGANHIEIGVGFQSHDGLQKTHIPSLIVHLANVEWEAGLIKQQGVRLRTGKLAYFFGDQEEFNPQFEDRQTLAAVMLQVARRLLRNGTVEQTIIPLFVEVPNLNNDPFANKFSLARYVQNRSHKEAS